jgi:DNA-binding NarL/FixJ family response regulator
MLGQLREIVSDLKVVYVSGYNNHGIQAATAGQKTSAYLSKPFKLSELAQAIRNVLIANR